MAIDNRMTIGERPKCLSRIKKRRAITENVLKNSESPSSAGEET